MAKSGDASPIRIVAQDFASLNPGDQASNCKGQMRG
jgi:hypothetical protein